MQKKSKKKDDVREHYLICKTIFFSQKITDAKETQRSLNRRLRELSIGRQGMIQGKRQSHHWKLNYGPREWHRVSLSTDARRLSIMTDL